MNYLFTGCPDPPTFDNTHTPAVTVHNAYYKVAEYTCTDDSSLFLEDGTSAESFKLTCNENAMWVGVQGKCRKSEIFFYHAL